MNEKFFMKRICSEDREELKEQFRKGDHQACYRLVLVHILSPLPFPFPSSSRPLHP
jgi:hypothetical protein